MKILNFASANIDYVYDVNHIVQPGETISAKGMDIFAGGKGLNQSVAAAKAGGYVYHAGFIGCDGDFLVEILQDSGADLKYTCRSENKNGHAMIQVNQNGENCIIVFPGTNALFTQTYIDEVLSDFSRDDILIVQNEITNLSYAIESAYQKGMTIVLNPSPFEDKLKALDFNLISWLILNETEAQGIFSTDDPRQIRTQINDRYPQLKVVLTRGVQGCVCLTKNEILTYPAYQVEAVDTTAAGDCFTGYFVSLIAAGADYENALKVASAASAITVSRKGAAPSIPYIQEVNAAFHTLKPYPHQEELLSAKRNEYYDK